jgi:heme A synthase
VTDVLIAIHPWIGYLVGVALLVAAVMAFGRAKDAREFVATPFSLTVVLVDVQVLLGILLYGLGGYWDASVTRPEIAYVHPALGFLALIVAHLGLRSARREPMAPEAHRKIGRALVTTLVIVLVSIGVAMAPPFL